MRLEGSERKQSPKPLISNPVEYLLYSLYSWDGEMGKWGDGEMERWGDGEMGRWGDGEMGRWGDEEMGILKCR
ncbi:hypothetical protein [Dapis sp. BLCC M126]|uniref:hypothetical protein n=1 Tax=Dapis sp. BLCC M126 TaxID=3400189 RepID=UPI003CED733C